MYSVRESVSVRGGVRTFRGKRKGNWQWHMAQSHDLVNELITRTATCSSSGELFEKLINRTHIYIYYPQ